MIRNDLLWALNLTLLPLSALAAYYSLKFQRYMAKKGYDDQPKGMVILVRAISALTCSICISSGLWMAWDLGFMQLGEIRDMGILIRGLFLFGVYLCCEFHHATMEGDKPLYGTIRDWFPLGIMVYFAVIYTIMVKI